jgi:hypothetical protein
MVCEHGCNETLCVRVDPEHAHAGTRTANLRYAVSLGRHRGSRPGNIDPRAAATTGPWPSVPPSPKATTPSASPNNATPRWSPPSRCSICP